MEIVDLFHPGQPQGQRAGWMRKESGSAGTMGNLISFFFLNILIEV